MIRSLPFSLVFTVSLLALAACGEDQSPTQPETAGDPAPVAASLALASNAWTAKAPIPGPAVGVSVGMFPNSVGQSIVYAFGGTDPFDDGFTPGDIFAYDVAANTWTFKGQPDSRMAVYNTNGVGKIGSKLYFTGGRFTNEEPGSPYTWAYDPAANRLTKKADMPRVTADGVTGVIDGKLWVLPGTCSGAFWPDPGYCDHTPIRRLYRYDPVANHWGSRRECPHYHTSGAGGVINGKFYVAGGADANLDVYDPATDTWRTLAPLPTAGRAIGAVLAGRLFVIAGSGSGRRAYAYDPGTNTWTPRATPTWDHDAVVWVLLGGQPHLLAVGAMHDIPDSPYFVANNSELYTR
jgi:N-acetylneuraminic acid mutarotase